MKNRQDDVNQGFFTKKETVNGIEVKTKIATFAVNQISDLTQENLNAIPTGINAVYTADNMPMDLQMNIDNTNSGSSEVLINFQTFDVKLGCFHETHSIQLLLKPEPMKV